MASSAFENNFDFLTSNQVWIAHVRSRARRCVEACFFFNDTATTDIYSLSLHDALPISSSARSPLAWVLRLMSPISSRKSVPPSAVSNLPRRRGKFETRSEEHTSELQSRLHLVWRLLLSKIISIF